MLFIFENRLFSHNNPTWLCSKYQRWSCVCFDKINMIADWCACCGLNVFLLSIFNANPKCDSVATTQDNYFFFISFRNAEKLWNSVIICTSWVNEGVAELEESLSQRYIFLYISLLLIHHFDGYFGSWLWITSFWEKEEHLSGGKTFIVILEYKYMALEFQGRSCRFCFEKSFYRFCLLGFIWEIRIRSCWAFIQNAVFLFIIIMNSLA